MPDDLSIVSDSIRSQRAAAFVAMICSTLAACAPASKPSQAARAAEAQPAARPLAPFMAHRVIVLPVQTLRRGDPLGWSARIAEPRDFLARIDVALADSLAARGLRGVWSSSETVVQAARRNIAYATDPHEIAAGQLRTAANRASGEPLPEPVASQLRTLVGLLDARYALVPLEVRFEPGTSGARAVLQLALIDARGSQVLLAREVATTPVAEFSPERIAGLAESIAGHVADLIAAP